MKIKKKVKGSYLIKGLKRCGWDDCPKRPGTRGLLREEDRRELAEYYEFLRDYNEKADRRFVRGERPRLEN